LYGCKRQHANHEEDGGDGHGVEIRLEEGEEHEGGVEETEGTCELED